MKQKLLLSGLAVSTVGITSYLLKDPSNRQKAREFIHSMKMKITKQPDMETFPVDKAGHPDPQDIEDNKMVSEGSMYPVQYYDEKRSNQKALFDKGRELFNLTFRLIPLITKPLSGNDGILARL